jgi:RNA polymerase sigma-70 factor (ECF subfamily)
LTADRNAADDLAQSTAVRALENASKYTAGTNLDRWLFTLARRIWLNEKRAETVRLAGGLVSIDNIDLASPGPGPETNILAREVFERIMALPEAQRETVLLVYVEGYKYREAAEVLGIPIGTIMSRLAAARRSIHETQDEERRRSL